MSTGAAPAGEAEDEQARAVVAGRWLFAQPCTFVRGVADLNQLPDAALPEVAFAGRSNVGKSSLINALTNRHHLARTSNTPGRTQQINLFDLGGQLVLADLPGYGFAQAPKRLVDDWQQLIVGYLRGRSVLRQVCVLIDARHGFKTADHSFFEVLGEAAVAFQVVLTKVDQLSGSALQDLAAGLGSELRAMAGAHPQVHATSARNGAGIDELRAALAALAEGKRPA